MPGVPELGFLNGCQVPPNIHLIPLQVGLFRIAHPGVCKTTNTIPAGKYVVRARANGFEVQVENLHLQRDKPNLWIHLSASTLGARVPSFMTLLA